MNIFIYHPERCFSKHFSFLLWLEVCGYESHMVKIFEGRIDSTPNTYTRKQVQDKGEIASSVYFQDNNNNKTLRLWEEKKDRKEHNKV